MVARFVSCLFSALIVSALALVVVTPPASAEGTLYVAASVPESILAYSILSSGALSKVPDSRFAVDEPNALAITPDGRYLYVAASAEDGALFAFSTSPSGFTPLGPVVGPEPYFGAIAVSPDGRHIYLSRPFVGLISGYTIAPDGSLTPIAGSPFTVGTHPQDVAMTPDGRYLYVTNRESNDVSAFSVASNGGLSAVQGSPFAAGRSPEGVAVTPAGGYLYVIDRGFNETPPALSAFSISSEGGLSSVSGSPFAVGNNTLGALAISPDGRRLYTSSNASGDPVSAFSIAAEGAVTAVSGSPFASGGFHPSDVAVAPDSRHLYVSNFGRYYEPGESSLSAMSIASDGSLSGISGSPFLAGGEGPFAIVVSPDQGPVAAFSVTPGPAGYPSTFNASASTAAEGAVASYRWEFGDGHTETSTTPATTHTYAGVGPHMVTLTVTDEAGCSTTQTFTGQTVSCNGSPRAQISHQVTVPTPELLNVWLGGSGSGTVTSSPSGISCPSTCTYGYAPGSGVTLTETPASGSTFAGWLGCKHLAATECEVAMNEASEVTAVFLKEAEAAVITPFSGALGGCTNGGLEVTANGHTTYVCDGVEGTTGAAGTNGADGKEGLPGSDGPQGKEGPRGPVGPPSRVTCRVKQPGKAEVKVTCIVTDASGSRLHLGWRFTRNGHTVTHGTSDGALRLDLRHLRPGRYLLSVQGQKHATAIAVR